MTGGNLPPGVTEAMIPGNRPWDLEIEKLFDELDGMIVTFLKDSDHVITADIPDLLRDLLKEYERLGQKTYKEAQEAVQKRAKRNPEVYAELLKAAKLITSAHCGFCGCDIHTTSGCAGCNRITRLKHAIAEKESA